MLEFYFESENSENVGLRSRSAYSLFEPTTFSHIKVERKNSSKEWWSMKVLFCRLILLSINACRNHKLHPSLQECPWGPCIPIFGISLSLSLSDDFKTYNTSLLLPTRQTGSRTKRKIRMFFVACRSLFHFDLIWFSWKIDPFLDFTCVVLGSTTTRAGSSIEG